MSVRNWHDPDRVEVLKVWYSVFCTLMDAYKADEYRAAQLITKLLTLRDELATRVPEVEEEMARHKQ